MICVWGNAILGVACQWTGSLVQEMACLLFFANHYLNPWCFFVNGTMGTIFHWNFNQPAMHLVQEKAFNSVTCTIVFRPKYISILGPKQNGRHCRHVRISIQISLKYILKDPFDIIIAMIYIMTLRRPRNGARLMASQISDIVNHTGK